LVRRETTQEKAGSGGATNTTRLVERPRPGNASDGLHVTSEAIDIVRPNGSGTSETQTILATDANGQTQEVWVDMGQSTKAPVAPADTKPAPKKK
jgi:hypothetical protein